MALSTYTVMILSLISAITAAPVNQNRAILGNVRPEETDMKDSIINTRYVPLENCKAIQDSGLNTTGLYTVRPQDNINGGEFTVFCDMELLGGGWTILQRRINNSINFNRKYKSYKNGFGNFFENFWLGLEKVYQLTHNKNTQMELYIGLEDFNGETAYARYSSFFIENEDAGYALRIQGFDPTSPAHDSLADHNGQRFSTEDVDRDALGRFNCAKHLKGGWWYKNCHDSNLNGVWYPDGRLKDARIPDGIIWEHWKGDDTSLKTVVIAIRPKN